MLSDSEMKRLADLDSIAAMGTENEQVLHQLLTRYDEVQRDINGLHKKMAMTVGVIRIVGKRLLYNCDDCNYQSIVGRSLLMDLLKEIV